MRARLPRSLSGQTLAVLTCTLVISHIIGIWVYSIDRGQAVIATEAHDFAERVVGMVNLLAHLPDGWRENLVRESDGRTFHVTLDAVPDVIAESLDQALATEIASFLVNELPDHSPDGIQVSLSNRPFVPRNRLVGHSATAKGAPENENEAQVFVHISIDLGETGWLNFVGDIPDPGRLWLIPAGTYILCIILGVGALAFWLVFRVTSPLTVFARAAERLGKDLHAEPLPETGPTEVAQAAHAFNAMQERLRRLVENRTQILAALSHDLKTPVTLLRLRAELMRDADEQAKVLDTVDEIEAMIASVLEFTKATLLSETPRRVDVTALLNSVCEDVADTGANVSFTPGERALITCRRVALKRALTNLVDNAVKYGGDVRVQLNRDDSNIEIVIDDDGPGIPDEALESIFMPFVRLDPSRGVDNGGVGLGLTIAQSIVHGHGGNITLANQPEGGLRVTLSLPV